MSFLLPAKAAAFALEMHAGLTHGGDECLGIRQVGVRVAPAKVRLRVAVEQAARICTELLQEASASSRASRLVFCGRVASPLDPCLC